MSSVDHEYYEYLMSQDKSDLAIQIMNLEMSSSNNRTIDSGFESLKDAMANDFLDYIRVLDHKVTLLKKYLEVFNEYINRANKEAEEQDA